jgi:hypothetical protein
MTRFFTWTEEQFTEPAQVSERMRRELRVLWLNGARVDQLARWFLDRHAEYPGFVGTHERWKGA